MKAMMRTSMQPFRRRLADFLRDRRGVAATEFAFVAPVMLIAFFGTVEFCSGVAVDRKVTLIARTLSDLTSQQSASANGNTSNDAAIIVDANLQNTFTASISIMASYDPSPTQATVSEIYVDHNKNAKVQWSKSAVIASGAIQATLMTSARPYLQDVTNVVPSQLLVPQTYLIFSEVGYQYLPTIGYVMSKTTGVNLSDVSYTRPRQATCIVYNNVPVLVSGTCPQS
jgi:Flp pilus assembly protein TadG